MVRDFAQYVSPMRATQRGAGLIETMIGVVIGLIVVLVIYNIFAVTEGYKRTTTGASDAQTTGQFVQFVLAREISNAGNGITSALVDMALCPAPGALPIVPGTPMLKPIPVLITDSGNPNVSDTITTWYSTAPRVVAPVNFAVGMATVNDKFQVQSPNGFRVNDQVIVMNGAGICDLRTVAAIAGPDPLGIVQLTPSIVPASTAYGPSSKAINIGQVGQQNQTRYDVANNQLRSTDLMTAGAIPNPIAANVVLMKAQYGIDGNNDGFIDPAAATDYWTPASNANPTGTDYSANAVAAYNTAQQISAIKAIRIAIVVRSDEYVDPNKDNDVKNQTAWLFNCSANTTAGCPNRIQINNAILADGFRHRIYETVVPIRNTIWNNTP
jgi:type IV pilus assembly protein PilW